MERIGTHNSYSQLIQYGVQLQASAFDQQRQLATSVKGEHYDDIAPSTLLVQNTQNMLLKNEGYSRSAKIKLAEIETKHATLLKVSDLLTRAKTLATDALGASTDAKKFDSVNQTAELLLKDLEALLNIKHDGGYLFGGTVTDKAPVKIKHAALAVQKAPSTADTKYYLGNDQSNFISLNETRVMEDSVNANTSAVEKSIRAIAMLTGAKNNERSTVQEAFTLLSDGITGVASMLSNTGNMASSIKEGLESHKALKLQTEATLTRLTKTDAAQVMADLANLQVLLQASYTSVAKNNQLSLLNFLR